MSVGVFTDRKHPPTEAEVLEAIGPRLPLWEALAAYLRTTYPVEEDFKFMYGKPYGWARRFRIKGQLLTSLYPTEGGFKAQLNLSGEAVERALTMGLKRNAAEAIAAAHPYPEGRWVFMPVESEEDLGDVKQLLALRVETKRLWKPDARH